MITWQSKRYRSQQREGRRRPWRTLLIGLAVVGVLISVGLEGALQIVLARDPVQPPAPAVRGDSHLSALPLIEVPARAPGDTLVIFYTGDNGWQFGDKGFTAELARRGYSVVVVDTLRYFLKAKSAPQAGADLSALIERYSTAWGRPKVIVAGYSFGADAAALILKQVTPEARARVQALALVAPGDKAELAMHPYSLLDVAGFDARPVGPAIAALGAMPVVCIYGLKDGGAACPRLDTKLVKPRPLAGDHLFLGEYPRVAEAIVGAGGG